MKIGFFGGTFDPPHFGHLNLAIQLKEKHQLDQVLFCPVGISPFKRSQPPQGRHKDRKRMVEMAIAAIPQFLFCSEEMDKEESFTIDTIRRLKKTHPQDDFYLLLGEDSFERFSEWKEAEELKRLAPLLVGGRGVGKSAKENITPIPIMDISSSEIRERLKKDLYCGHLIPANVLDYICANKLYFIS